jgi:hypothetical protein
VIFFEPTTIVLCALLMAVCAVTSHDHDTEPQSSRPLNNRDDCSQAVAQ